jgi:hypothetical protein
MNDFFTPTEQSLLCDYLGMPRPEAYQTLDLGPPADGRGIFVEEPNDNQVVEATPLRNAVARIALGVIQNRLPQCGIIDGDGRLTLTRKRFERPIRDVVMLPQHLFTINWADSGPGISWPEEYHSTYIPGFDHYVVTAAFDGTDMYGVTELAIGSFEGDRDPAEGCADIVKGWWHYLQDNCQPRWAYVWNEALISKDTAEDWADEVWIDGWPHIEDEVVVIQSESSDEDDVAESLRLIVMEIIDPGGETSNRKKKRAYDGLRECLDQAATPRQALLKVVDYVRQLGHRGSPLVGDLVGLLKEEREAERDDLLIEIVAALTDIKPTDREIHDYMVELLLDVGATATSRCEAARFLIAVTGIDAYQKIVKSLHSLGKIGISSRAAPHDSSIYISRDWFTPRPTSDQNDIADHCLATVLAECANITCSEVEEN